MKYGLYDGRLRKLKKMETEFYQNKIEQALSKHKTALNAYNRAVTKIEKCVYDADVVNDICLVWHNIVSDLTELHNVSFDEQIEAFNELLEKKCMSQERRDLLMRSLCHFIDVQLNNKMHNISFVRNEIEPMLDALNAFIVRLDEVIPLS